MKSHHKIKEILSKKDVSIPHQINLPESSLSRSGLRLKTELRFDGIGKLGFGRFFKAANACCTASCLTSLFLFIARVYVCVLICFFFYLLKKRKII
jgi:hypothetical protein